MTQLDFAHVLRLRLAVARYGESDGARWWNTQLLGAFGGQVMARNFPRTHRFARARALFEIAAERCRSFYNPPNAVTLFTLPPDLEDLFDQAWAARFDEAEAWLPLFEALEPVPADPWRALRLVGVAADGLEKAVASLREDASGRGLALPARPLDEAAMTLLAAAFVRAVPGLRIPYLPIGG
ncbi:MAG: BrxE family protein [Alphaproteobacteria bacterium]|nr:BrxE family protein [Alphaproteobacteria bacterium]